MKFIDIVAILVSIVVGYFLTVFIAEAFPDIGASSIPFFIWGFFIIALPLAIRRLYNRGIPVRRKSPWGSPEETRDRVVSAPQFVGRYDRGKGLLETTARLVEKDQVYDPKDFTLIRFRGEILDQNGAVLEQVPVEIRGEASKWIGSIVDGDRVRVEGKVKEDGILHAEKAFNYSTNSWVGEKR